MFYSTNFMLNPGAFDNFLVDLQANSQIVYTSAKIQVLAVILTALGFYS